MLTFSLLKKKQSKKFILLRCAKSKTYMKFFLPFLFFISKAHNMRWKNLTLVFDENALFSFYGPNLILHILVYKSTYVRKKNFFRIF